jgi:DNA-binding LacI/PurR family transcriptional regulator
MRLAIDHLIGLGHRSIVHVDGGTGTKASDRRRGYRDAMRRAGLAELVQVITGGETAERGRCAGREILALDPLPTALVAYNDECAHGLMRTLADSGRSIPADMSVIGYDGSQSAASHARELTTIRQDVQAMARRSVERVVARLTAGAPAEPDLVLQPELEVGETTAPSGAPIRPGSPPAPRTAGAITTQELLPAGLCGQDHRGLPGQGSSSSTPQRPGQTRRRAGR